MTNRHETNLAVTEDTLKKRGRPKCFDEQEVLQKQCCSFGSMAMKQRLLVI